MEIDTEEQGKKAFYSVADHTVAVSEIWPADYGVALLHDMMDHADHDHWRKLYQQECEASPTYWVIPHHSSLDYCAVTIIGEPDLTGMIRVEGYQNEGWRKSGGHIRTKVRADKLTKTPSWHVDFLKLYEDPCHPKENETRYERRARIRASRGVIKFL